ncbi:MAG: hypothetical protein NZ749_13865, partial [bacterium]|nr:hypothetical protein [bacterium]
MMLSVWDIVLLLLLMAYVAAQVGVLVVWGIHTYYVRKGMPGLLAERWSLLDLWIGFHLALLFTFLSLAAMAALMGFSLAIFSPQHVRLLQQAFDTLDRNAPLFWLGLLSLLLVQNGAFVVVAVWYVLGKYGMDANRAGLSWDWKAARQGVLWGGFAFAITPLVELLSTGVLRLVLGASAFERLMYWEKQYVALDA